VVYLSNGSVVRGLIIEQIPNESLKIKTADGSVFAFKMSEVTKITKEEVLPGRGAGAAMGSGPRKEPAVAALLSLVIPGAGQVYNGQTGKGIIQFVLAAGGMATYIVFEKGYDYSYYGGYDDYYKETGNETVSYLGLGVAVGASLWSLIDAPVTASKMNRERGYSKVDPPKPAVNLSLANIRAGGTSSPGLLLRMTF
jgi:TM2 domain-containing membrane protein YozV